MSKIEIYIPLGFIGVWLYKKLEQGLPVLVQTRQPLRLPLCTSQPLRSSSRVFHSANGATDHLLSTNGADQMILFTPEDRGLGGDLKADRALKLVHHIFDLPLHELKELRTCLWQIRFSPFRLSRRPSLPRVNFFLQLLNFFIGLSCI